MITVPMDKLWLNSTADLTDCMSFVLNDYTYTQTPNYTVAEWSAGAMRSTGTSGVPVTAQATLGFISDEQADWLLGHVGLPVWVREFYGHRFVAICPAVEAAPYYVPDLWSTQLSLTGVTHSDAV